MCVYIDTYLYHEIFVDVDVISVGIFIDENYEKLNRLVISFILGMEEELNPKFFSLILASLQKMWQRPLQWLKNYSLYFHVLPQAMVIFLEAL